MELPQQPSPHLRKPKKAKSKVWTYFEQEVNEKGEVNYNKAFCVLCKSKVGYYNSTTNLSQHLLGKHKKEFDILFGSDKCQLKLAYTEHRMSKKMKQQLDIAIANMIAVDMQPISMVENPGFQFLLKTAVPGNINNMVINLIPLDYQIPCRATFRNTILPKMYNEDKQMLKGNF